MRILTRASLVVAVMAYAGCTSIVGRGSERATRGALRAAGEKAHRIDPAAVAPVAEAGAGAVVTGALVQVDEPAQQRQLAELVTLATAAAMRGVAGAELEATIGAIAGLGASRTLAALARALAVDAPLRHGLREATRELAGSAMDGARDELSSWWGCTGRDEPRCIERRLVELTRELTRGATQGACDTLAVGLLTLAFVAGVLLTVIVVAVVLVVRRQPRRSQATSSVAPPSTPA